MLTQRHFIRRKGITSVSTQSTLAISVGYQVGDRAPDFTLHNQYDEPVHFYDLIGTSPIVLYFYPKDNSPTCTAEACAFRDSYEAFSEAGAMIIGISADSVKSHRRFAETHRLPFQLLSDPNREVHKAYYALAAFGLLNNRVTFVIDREGIIRYRFADMLNAKRHVDEALQIIRAL
ncbi:MAG: peroxiredoxin [Anaerolineae bacterium]